MAHSKNKTRFKSLDKIAADPRVEEIWSEDDGYCAFNDATGEYDETRRAIWVQLAPGWRNAEGTSCLHECSVAAIIREFKNIEKGDIY